MRTLERRLELLKLEGDGFNTSEIVKLLTAEFACSERTVYYDMANRSVWQPRVQQFKDGEKLLLKILNRLEQIYCKASFKFLHSQNEQVQLGALKIMAEVTGRVCDLHVITDIEARLRNIEGKVLK